MSYIEKMIRWIISFVFLSAHLVANVYVSDEAVCDDIPVTRADQVPKTHIAWSDDEFLTGYVQSLIDMHYYEFRVRVVVKGRVAYLFNLPKNALIADGIYCFVKDVPCLCGVERVECCPEVFFGYEQPSSQRLPYCQTKGIWFPQNTVLFQPFIADPRQVTNSAAFRWNDDVIGKHVGAVSFGDIFPFYRWLGVLRWKGDLEAGIEAGIFSVFDLDNIEECMVNTDFFVAARLAYAIGKWAYRFRLWHMSSHLGDEFLLGHPEILRRNLSDEGVDAFASFQITRMIRFYGGIGYIYSRDDEFPEHPLYIEYGTEVKVFGCRDLFNRLHVQPFLAMHFRNWEEHHFDLDGTYAIGIQYGKIQGVGKKFRIFGEYHEGHCREGQFVRKRSSYVALRVTYGY